MSKYLMVGHGVKVGSGLSIMAVNEVETVEASGGVTIG